MRNLICAGVAILSLLAVPVSAQPAPSAQHAIEAGLAPAAVFDGKAERWTLAERMARWNVPGVSVAVVDDGRIVWARGYGVLAAGGAEPVTARTRFQAASISKPVAALAAMSLVQAGKLSLDGDINAALRSWKFPASPFTAGRPLTLKDLLSHTGGTTVHGFGGYAQGAPVPTLVQILNGAAPANSPAVVSERRPGEAWNYSGGGYEIVQQLIEDVTGKPFAEVVRDRVLVPAGMTDSGYALPAPADFARAHGVDGKLIPGGWHSYPEQAAAGLWTTPTDLARFGLALVAAWRGDSGAILDRPTATAMTTPVMGGYGLGPAVEGEGDALIFAHGGSNEGFRCVWIIHPRTGDGVVVMTNGEAGDKLMSEIMRGVAVAYGWPDQKPTAYTTFPLAADMLAARLGDWSVDLDGERVVFTARPDPHGLSLVTARGTLVFTPVSATEMVAAETGATATFATGADGKTVLKVYGLELRKGG